MLYLFAPNGFYKPIITYVSSICKCHFSVNLEIRQPIFYHIASPNNGNHLICSYFPLYLLCSPFALARRVDTHTVDLSKKRLKQDKFYSSSFLCLVCLLLLVTPIYIIFINNIYIHNLKSSAHLTQNYYNYIFCSYHESTSITIRTYILAHSKSK